MIIFVALYGSLILFSLLYTLGSTYNIYVLNKNMFSCAGNYDGLHFDMDFFYANSRK